ncbi:hypothetical protein DFS33DRAFT_1268969 [Desarmillaria ectypa]|nr:hypothetical protein DFS33DRAFT_1268969 [Desarmillaria ectypa]
MSIEPMNARKAVFVPVLSWKLAIAAVRGENGKGVLQFSPHYSPRRVLALETAAMSSHISKTSMAASFNTSFGGLTTRRTSEMMLDNNLRQLAIRILKDFGGPVTRVPEHIETQSTDSWAVVPANNSGTTSASAMENRTRFDRDEESPVPLELISTIEIERLFQRMLRRFKRKLRERRQRHPPIEYFADGCPVPKDHPDVDEIIMYPQPDSECQSSLELPHTNDTASRESLVLSGGDRKDLAIPGYGPMPAFHFVDDNPPASEISFRDLPIDHATFGYTTSSNPFSEEHPRAFAFPPQTTNVVIPKPYGHNFIDVSHDVSPSVRFNPFADDGPIVDQTSLEGQSCPANVNRGRPVFTDPFNNNHIILDNTTFGTAPNKHTQSSPKHQYAGISTEYAYTQTKAAERDQVKSYPSSQFIYSQYDRVSRTNTGNSSSSSSSRTFVNDSEPAAPRIFYWVDRFNKLRKI